MNFCEQIFGKRIEQIRSEDIVVFFSEPQEENNYLEFKSINPHKHINDQIGNVARAVTAFLNSGGGIVIFGAPKKDTVTGKFLGQLTPGDWIDKDSLVSKIAQQIQPLPYSFTINPIEIKDRKCVYIIEIQESSYNPHQWNGEYPMRLDGQTVKAPHYYVDALFKKIKIPDIEGYIKVNGVQYNRSVGFIVDITIFIANFSPNINEKQLGYLLTPTEGLFTANRQRILKTSLDILSFGMPFKESHKIYYSLNWLDQPLNIILNFWGEVSPARISHYEITVASDYTYKVKVLEQSTTFEKFGEGINLDKEAFKKDFLS